jgi:AIR carboxylase
VSSGSRVGSSIRCLDRGLASTLLEELIVVKTQPRVGILMGSDSDLEVMREAEKRLDTFGISYETRILSGC